METKINATEMKVDEGATPYQPLQPVDKRMLNALVKSWYSTSRIDLEYFKRDKEELNITFATFYSWIAGVFDETITSSYVGMVLASPIVTAEDFVTALYDWFAQGCPDMRGSIPQTLQEARALPRPQMRFLNYLCNNNPYELDSPSVNKIREIKGELMTEMMEHRGRFHLQGN